jgi:hypothetical protein
MASAPFAVYQFAMRALPSPVPDTHCMSAIPRASHAPRYSHSHGSTQPVGVDVVRMEREVGGHLRPIRPDQSLEIVEWLTL